MEMNLQDPYLVPTWTRPCSGSVRVPGSKSITNRALVLSALSQDIVRLDGALFSRDSALLAENLRALGFVVEEDAKAATFIVHGQGGNIPRAEADLFVGNAGTAARFLTAFVCLHPNGTFNFDGDAEMQERPMQGLIDALERLGARFSFSGKQGHFPFQVRTSGLRGGHWAVEASASSQMLSALMMIAPFASEEVVLNAPGVRPAFVEMTARMMEQFGHSISGTPHSGYRVSPRSELSHTLTAYSIEPDATAATYFMVLPYVVGGSLLIEGMPSRSLQGDVAFADVLRSIGFIVEMNQMGWEVSYQYPFLDTSDQAFSFECFSDTFLTLAAVAPLFPFSLELSGIAHTRHQETDRIAAMVEGLRRTGARVSESEGALRVFPYALTVPPAPVSIRTFKDHRVAMAFAVLGCRDRWQNGSPWMQIIDPACCGKTFPGFFEKLHELYLKSHDKN